MFVDSPHTLMFIPLSSSCGWQLFTGVKSWHLFFWCEIREATRTGKITSPALFLTTVTFTSAFSFTLYLNTYSLDYFAFFGS